MQQHKIDSSIEDTIGDFEFMHSIYFLKQKIKETLNISDQIEKEKHKFAHRYLIKLV